MKQDQIRLMATISRFFLPLPEIIHFRTNLYKQKRISEAYLKNTNLTFYMIYFLITTKSGSS